MLWEIVGFLPQVIKIYRTKSVKDLSLLAILQFILGIFLWLIYGIYLNSFVIILANSVTFFILLAALVLFLKYAKSQIDLRFLIPETIFRRSEVPKLDVVHSFLCTN
jgi:MtN3 and saliva related transmembrane protein